MRDELLSLLSRYLPGPFKISGTNIVHRCPFHKDGQETSPSFGVDFEKGGVFNCFSCHAHGDLETLLKELGATTSTAVAEVKALGPEIARLKKQHKFEMKNFFISNDPFRAEYVLPEVILSVFEWMPLSLVEKGFDPALLQKMEVGYDKENNRITYPLRDMYGNLAGISGGAALNQWPKYKVYQGGRKENGQWTTGDFGKWFDKQHPGYRCENHDFLWNYHRVFAKTTMMSAPIDTIYVTEGFKACLWMIQAGFTNTICSMGSYLSERQQRMLHRFGGTVVLCFDNDEAGRRATESVGRLLWRPLYGRIKVLPYPAGHDKTQPDHYPVEQLQMMGQSAVSYRYVPLRRQNSNSSESKPYGNDKLS